MGGKCPRCKGQLSIVLCYIICPSCGWEPPYQFSSGYDYGIDDKLELLDLVHIFMKKTVKKHSLNLEYNKNSFDISKEYMNFDKKIKYG